MLLKVSGYNCKIGNLKNRTILKLIITLTGGKISCVEGHYVYKVVKRGVDKLKNTLLSLYELISCSLPSKSIIVAVSLQKKGNGSQFISLLHISKILSL